MIVKIPNITTQFNESRTSQFEVFEIRKNGLAFFVIHIDSHKKTSFLRDFEGLNEVNNLQIQDYESRFHNFLTLFHNSVSKRWLAQKDLKWNLKWNHSVHSKANSNVIIALFSTFGGLILLFLIWLYYEHRKSANITENCRRLGKSLPGRSVIWIYLTRFVIGVFRSVFFMVRILLVSVRIFHPHFPDGSVLYFQKIRTGPNLKSIISKKIRTEPINPDQLIYPDSVRTTMSRFVETGINGPRPVCWRVGT